MSTTGNSRVGMSGMTATQRLAHARSANANRVKPGERFISPTNAGAQMTPARMAAVRPPSGIRPTRQRPIISTGGPSPQRVTMGPTRNRPVGGGAGPVDRAVRDIPEVLKNGKKGKLMNNKGLMIGAGAAVIAGLAMNRRGDGTSSGRSGMTRY